MPTDLKMNAWVEDTMKRNPGLTREAAVNEFFLARAEQEAKPLGQVVREWYADLVKPPTEALGGGIGRFFQGMTQGPQGFLRPAEGPTAATGQALAETVIPQTPEAAALMAAAGPLQRLAPFAGRGGILNPPLRVGAATALGAGTAELTGGSAAEGATAGLVGGLAGEGVRATQVAGQLWKEHMGTRANKIRWSMEDARDAVVGAVREVPQLLAGLRRGEPAEGFLARLERKASPKDKHPLGQKLLSDHFQKTEEQVLQVMAGREIVAPAFFTRRGVPPPTTGAFVPIAEALEEVKLATAAALKAPPGATGFALRENAKQMREQVVAAVSQQNPSVGALYEAEAGLYRRGRIFLEALTEGHALRGPVRSAKHEVFDGNQFLEYLRNNGYQGELPQVEARLLRGSQLNALDIERTLPRGRIYKAGESVTFMLPTLRTERRGGFSPLRVGPLPGITEAVAASGVSGYTVE